MVKSLKLFNVSSAEKKDITEKLIGLLLAEQSVLFAYLHGSFNEEGSFRDIDIAVYLDDNVPKAEMLDKELKLEEAIESAFRYPVDVRVLNSAPAHFSYMAIKKGLRMAIRDDKKRVSFEMRTLKEYFDFLPFRRRYLRGA